MNEIKQEQVGYRIGLRGYGDIECLDCGNELVSSSETIAFVSGKIINDWIYIYCVCGQITMVRKGGMTKLDRALFELLKAQKLREEI